MIVFYCRLLNRETAPFDRTVSVTYKITISQDIFDDFTRNFIFVYENIIMKMMRNS